MNVYTALCLITSGCLTGISLRFGYKYLFIDRKYPDLLFSIVTIAMAGLSVIDSLWLLHLDERVLILMHHCYFIISAILAIAGMWYTRHFIPTISRTFNIIVTVLYGATIIWRLLDPFTPLFLQPGTMVTHTQFFTGNTQYYASGQGLISNVTDMTSLALIYFLIIKGLLFYRRTRRRMVWYLTAGLIVFSFGVLNDVLSAFGVIRSVPILTFSFAGIIIFVELNHMLVFKNSVASLKNKREALIASNRQLNARLREKEILIKEIHHRVKNNLQVISSIVSLQSRQADNSHVRPKLEALRNRVYSMARVYDHLYRDNDLSTIALDRFIHDYLHTCRKPHSDSSLTIDLFESLEPVPLCIEHAIPCALIMNELVSNAFLHAFSGRNRGRIDVILRRQADDATLELIVTDDGIGFMDSAQEKLTDGSLGLSLARTLACQLNARLEITTNEGTRCRLSIPFNGS